MDVLGKKVEQQKTKQTMTNAERCREYRKRISLDPELKEWYRLKHIERNRRNRNKPKSDEQRAKERELARLRVKRFRDKLKAKKAAEVCFSRQMTPRKRTSVQRDNAEAEARRKKWAEEKRLQREKWTLEQWQKFREANRQAYHRLKAKETADRKTSGRSTVGRKVKVSHDQQSFTSAAEEISDNVTAEALISLSTSTFVCISDNANSAVEPCWVIAEIKSEETEDPEATGRNDCTTESVETYKGIRTDTGYDDWEPPSEAQIKLLQARRERSDKISKIMGDYLLKGYKMLGVTCPQCDTILLQTKQGSNYCIACSELDSDADKDDPVTNQVAALALAREREIREPPSGPTPVTPPASQPSFVRNTQTTVVTVGASSTASESPAAAFLQPQEMNISANAVSASERGSGSGKYVRSLLDKLDWATGELRGTQSVEYSIQLCQLVKSCADAVASVKAAFDS